MKHLRALAMRMAGLFPSLRRDQELAAELESHLALHADDFVRAGLSPQEARRQAILKLGGIEPTREACRDRRTLPFMETLINDLRFALRQLAKNPGFTATAVLMTSLGICASVAIFAFVDAALLKPLPYSDPNRLVAVYESLNVCPRCNLSYEDYLDWKKMNTSFSSLEVFTNRGSMLSTPGGVQPVRGARVSAGFFRTLGVRPTLGRDFLQGEDLPGAPKTVLLSYAAWQNRFAGAKDVVGRTLTIDESTRTIIGVLPGDFHFAPTEPADFWYSLDPSSGCEKRRSCHNLYGVGRLKDGVSFSSAFTEMKGIAARLEKQYPDSNRDQGAMLVPLPEVISGKVRPVLLMLLGGAVLLLVISGINVASLLLVRSESRRREVAVRNALGAGRFRLVRQFATEGLLLAGIGSALGVAGAAWTVGVLTRLIPRNAMAQMSFLNGLGLNVRVWLFALGISLLAAMVFAITPSLRISGAEIRAGLGEGSRGSSGNAWRRLGSKLVIVELATAMVLLVGAALLGQSFYRLLHVSLGFPGDHLATLTIAAPDSRYPKPADTVALTRRITAEVSALPGVRSVGLTDILPVSFNGNTTWIRVVGHPYNGEHNDVLTRDVSAGYFPTLGAKLVRGRYFTDADDASKPSVLIINQACARRYFPGEDPLGKMIGNTSLSADSLRQVVGIVEDVRDGALDETIRPAIYAAMDQDRDTNFSLVVRTSLDESLLLPTLTELVRGIDPGIGIIAAAGLSERISDTQSAWLHRASAWLAGGFSIAALLLGVVGLYGVVAYSVGRRTREIGVRMALGAQSATVCGFILKEAAWLTAIGVILGVLGSMATSKLISDLLFGVHPWDVPTLLGVGALLTFSAMLASYIPARRAARVEPVNALRAE